MELANKTIYQVFVRNYSPKGDLHSLDADLERIKDLGIDILYLMPIHPIGENGRKGTYGSPYSVRDYYEISPDLGNKEDFLRLIDHAHGLGLQVIMDMVFNHTARDSVLLDEHPEFYYRENGQIGNRIGDWSDVCDLETGREDVQDYLVDVLAYWRGLGIDGFRFDVASLIPLSLFERARKRLGNDIFFLSESIDPDFARYVATLGLHNTDDKNLYPTFDATYNYNWFRDLERYLRGETPLSGVKKDLMEQIASLPGRIKISALENHDTHRIASYFDKGDQRLWNLIAFSFVFPGMPFVYAGEEYLVSKDVPLFEKHPIDKNTGDMHAFSLFKKLIALKKNPLFSAMESIRFIESDPDGFSFAFSSLGKHYYFHCPMPGMLPSCFRGEAVDLISGERVALNEPSDRCYLVCLEKENRL